MIALQLRKERVEEVEAHVRAVNQAFKDLNGVNSSDEANEESDGDDAEDEDEEWQGIEEDTKVEYEDEYIDEGKFTTVTVEEVGIDKDGFVNLTEKLRSGVVKVAAAKPVEEKDTKAGKKKEDKSKKRKKRSFRYESKEERDKTRFKEKAKKKKFALARKTK